MPETPDSARSQKLGGIPVAQAPGVYRKPPAFKMQAIPRPPEEKTPLAGKSRLPRAIGILLAVALLGSDSVL